MFDIIIIGGGPAGLSAAIYSTTRNQNVLVIEKSKIGGLIKNVSTVTHYLGANVNESGSEFSLRLAEQAKKYQLNIVYEDVRSVDLMSDVKTVNTEDNSYKARKIIIANGCSPKKLSVEGDANLIKKYFGLNSSLDGEGFKGKNVYVIGGGDGAIKEALYLSKIVNKLTVIHELNELNCIGEFKDKLEKTDNIDLLLNTRLVRINGHDRIESLDLLNLKSNEKFNKLDPGAGVFVYAGTSPNTAIYSQLKLVNGYIATNEMMETEIKNVYAAGDIRVKSIRQIATAVSDGTIAGVNASK